MAANSHAFTILEYSPPKEKANRKIVAANIPVMVSGCEIAADEDVDRHSIEA